MKNNNLPDMCYCVLDSTLDIIIVKKGESGFHPTNIINPRNRAEAQALVDAYNRTGGVSQAQAAAMLAGSLFGWNTPAADPENYDEDGNPIRPANSNHGSAAASPYIFRVGIIHHPDAIPDADPSKVIYLNLPATAEQIRTVETELGEYGWLGTVYNSIEGVIPDIEEYTNTTEDLPCLNQWAEKLSRMSPADLISYKKWLSAGKNHSIDRAISLADEITHVVNNYSLTLRFPEVNDSISVSIPAASPEEALAQIHASGDAILEAEEQNPSDCSESASKVYVETIRVSRAKLDRIYTCVFGKGDNDEVITETAVFPDGMEMDIKACGEMDDPGWTEAVLFRNGSECGHTDCEEKFEGVWSIQTDDVMYVAVVIPESSPWLSPNIITIPGSCLDSTAPVIAHQTNCKGVMGAGVALAIRNRYPEVIAPYQAACMRENMLGKCQLIETEDEHYIANLFGQDGFGQGRQTDYEALTAALKSLVDKMENRCLSAVSMPYNLGCGLAGGDWAVVSEILKDVFKDAYIRLELWKL